MRRLNIVSFCAVVALLVPSAALGAGPVREPFELDAVFPEQPCGVLVSTDYHLKGQRLLWPDGDVWSIYHVRFRMTNAEGDWLEVMAAGPWRTSTTVNPDGTVTTTTLYEGVQIRTTSSNGVIYAERGWLEFTVTVDLGDPADPADDSLVSTDVSWHGPHPAAASGYDLVCDVIEAVLG